jgi:hypothetical protein
VYSGAARDVRAKPSRESVGGSRGFGFVALRTAKFGRMTARGHCGAFLRLVSGRALDLGVFSATSGGATNRFGMAVVVRFWVWEIWEWEFFPPRVAALRTGVRCW